MDNAAKLMNKLVENISKVIVGKKDVIKLIVLALSCESHVLIEDVPGVGKTTLVSALAKSAGSTFKRIQFTPDIMPSDITGFSMYNPKENKFIYQKGNIFSNILLADEINRTPPKTQASLLEIMEENQVTVDGVTYPMEKPFMVLATQNPIEYVGTYPLPEAQLDRFLMKLEIGYPDTESENKMLSLHEKVEPIKNLESITNKEEIIEMQKEVKEVSLDDSLKRYIVSLAKATRNHPKILLGASPRASLNLALASRANALFDNRDYVVPDDIQTMIYPVWNHRIIINQEARMKNTTSKDILKSILQLVKVPVKTK